MLLKIIKQTGSYKVGQIIEIHSEQICKVYLERGLAVEHKEITEVQTKDETVELGEHIYDVVEVKEKTKKYKKNIKHG